MNRVSENGMPKRLQTTSSSPSSTCSEYVYDDDDDDDGDETLRRHRDTIDEFRANIRRFLEDMLDEALAADPSAWPAIDAQVTALARGMATVLQRSRLQSQRSRPDEPYGGLSDISMWPTGKRTPSGRARVHPPTTTEYGDSWTAVSPVERSSRAVDDVPESPAEGSSRVVDDVPESQVEGSSRAIGDVPESPAEGSSRAVGDVPESQEEGSSRVVDDVPESPVEGSSRVVDDVAESSAEEDSAGKCAEERDNGLPAFLASLRPKYDSCRHRWCTVCRVPASLVPSHWSDSLHDSLHRQAAGLRVPIGSLAFEDSGTFVPAGVQDEYRVLRVVKGDRGYNSPAVRDVRAYVATELGVSEAGIRWYERVAYLTVVPTRRWSGDGGQVNVVGYLEAEPIATAGAKYGVSRLWVMLRHRRRGVGTAMLEAFRSDHALSKRDLAFAPHHVQFADGRAFLHRYYYADHDSNDGSFAIYTTSAAWYR